VTGNESASCRNAFSGKRFPALDGLRLIAMLEVVLYHAGYRGFLDGVQCFFVLSGFLFAVLLQREFDRTGTISLTDFYRRRFLRIFPAFLAAVVATIAFKSLIGAPVDYRHAFASVTCWGNYYNVLNDHPPTGFSSFWTLGVEQQFYVVFPIVLLICFKTGGQRSAMTLLAVATVASAAWRAFAATGLQAGSAYLYNAFENRIDQFAVGALCGLSLATPAMQRLISVAGGRAWAPLVTLCLLVLLDQSTAPAWRFGVSMTLATPLLACLMLQLIALHQHRAWRWLEHPWIVYGGALSYSGYLYHHLGLALGHQVPFGGPLAGIACTLAAAAVSYHLIEQPVLRSGRRGRGTGGSEKVAAANLRNAGVSLFSAVRPVEDVLHP